MIPSTDTVLRLPRRDPGRERDLSTLTRLRGLVQITRLARSADDVAVLLDQVARVISDSLGYRTVVINLYRDAWDDFEVTTVYGSDDAAAALLGTTQGWDVWAPLLDAQFDRGGAYFVPQGQVDWSNARLHSFVPSLSPERDPDAWLPEDALFVPLSDSSGTVRGIVSVDEPGSGLRPADEELDVLVAVAQHAAAAIEHAQEAARQAQHRAALEQLAFVSSHLTATLPVDAVLQSICDGITSALGFLRVTIELLDRDSGRFRPRAAAGWRLDDAAVQVATTSADLLALCEPQFEVEGCFLLSSADAQRRVPAGRCTYSSQLNGRGPNAWNHHWLVVPLHDREGTMTGFIWADDPADRLLPTRDRLQALRMFANQTQTALDFAEQFTRIREGGEPRG